MNKEIYWGTALWNFFHVLANKIKPHSFKIIRMELLELIYLMCNNIDCNICKKHSIEYLEKNNFIHITSVNELKIFFFIFHNSVNLKNKKELFLFDNLTKYNDIKFSYVLQNILKYDYVFNKELDLESKIKKWFNDNIDYFEHI
jgi:hypothetical protein